MRPLAIGTALLVAAVVAAAGIGAAPGEPHRVAQSLGPPPPELVRGCRSAIVLVRPTARLRRDSTLAGRAWLVGGRLYEGERAKAFAPAGGVDRFAMRRLLVWTGGRDVTLVVPPEARARFGLAYSHGLLWPGRRIDGWRIADLHHVVKFKACTHPIGAYEGAVVPAGPGCVPLDVWIQGARRPIRRNLSFGAGPDCAPRD